MEYKYSTNPCSKIGLKEAKFICENYGKMSSGDIAKKLNQKIICRNLKLNNIKILPKGHFNILNLPIKKIAHLYFEKKLSRREIGKIYKVSEVCIGLTLRREGYTLRTISEARHKNSRRVNSNGYIIVNPRRHEKHFNPNKNPQMFEHRLVMARHLGRALYKHENVHHINGDRQDNRLENLELWSSSQPPGQRVQEKIEWAKQLLKKYKNLK